MYCYKRIKGELQALAALADKLNDYSILTIDCLIAGLESARGDGITEEEYKLVKQVWTEGC